MLTSAEHQRVKRAAMVARNAGQRYGRGRARTVLKHKVRLRMRQALPLLVAPAVLAAVAAPLWWPAALPALAWAALCLTYGAKPGSTP